MVRKTINALGCLLIASLAFAQMTKGQKTTPQQAATTKTGSGIITSTYEPGEIIVVGSEGAQDSFTFVLDKRLPYVNKAGKALDWHLIKRGTPVHLYYHPKGQTRVVNRVVVDQD
jgi:hypothetical protein